MAFSLTSDMDFLKKLPAYKPLLKTVLKAQIQLLVNQLSEYADEESVFLTASMTDGTLSHIGSKSGQVFLDSNEEIKSHFLKFCLGHVGGVVDSNRIKNSKNQLPGPQRHKKVSRQRTDFTKFKRPEAKKVKILRVAAEDSEVDVNEKQADVNVDAHEKQADVNGSENSDVKCEIDEKHLAKVNNEENESNKEVSGLKTGSKVTHVTGDTKDNIDSVHKAPEDSDDALQDDNIIIKIEPNWEVESEGDEKNIEDKYNMEHTSDLRFNTQENSSSCPSTSSGKLAAHLQPEFLCCNDNLIWEKNFLPKQKRVIKTSSLLTKYSVIKEVEQCQKSKAVIAEEFGIPKSTLSTWLKHSERIKADVEGEKIDPNKKKRRFSNFYDIEEALLEWLKIVHLQAVIPKITSVNICDKANQLAHQFGYTPETFQCSKAWVDRFKTRHGFKKNFVKGDSCSGD